ncbi:hypothetical protein M501DRAFT_996796 [Patellaria atrata CBS 101060]|uniref:Uncharacterized protein n=1 Tax=Patellaria atrata CBS 101060 TaxID=1346257 RepID=A0A9P4S5J8_9PEZI|nr:hypothetical protein M501DRAFT_996796 [Patellaria atrata CBS 101060]
MEHSQSASDLYDINSPTTPKPTSTAMDIDRPPMSPITPITPNPSDLVSSLGSGISRASTSTAPLTASLPPWRKQTSNNPAHPSRILKRHTKAFTDKIAKLRLRLAPIHPLPTGPPHPAFPATYLHFYLLTEDELDSMARYYSQVSPDAYTFMYPECMRWDKAFLSPSNEKSEGGANGEEYWRLTKSQRLWIKRRKFGKFIGLRGCETPVEEIKMRVRMLEVKARRDVEMAVGRGAKWM